MGLGTYTYAADTEGAITLKQARELAKHFAGLRSQGLDPITERDKERKLAMAEKAAAIGGIGSTKTSWKVGILTNR